MGQLGTQQQQQQQQQQQRQAMIFADMLQKVGGDGRRWGVEAEQVASGESQEGSKKIPTIEEFLSRFRQSVSDCLTNAYTLEHERNENEEIGTLTSTLPEDVFSLVNIQVGLIDQYLVLKKILGTNKGDEVLIDCLLSVIRTLHSRQSHYRNDFLLDLESTCASANDFYRMMEMFDDLMESLKDQYPHLSWDTDFKRVRHRTQIQDLAKESSELLSLFGNDSVYAVQHAHTFVLKQVRQSSIESDLFSRDWEDDIHNNIVLSLVKTVEDFLYDCFIFLSNEFLYRKIVAALIRGMVCFYIRTLLRKADDLRRTRRPLKRRSKEFKNPLRALVRMMYDIQVLQTYMENLVQQLPSLQRLVESELSILVVVHELMGMAAGETNVSTLEEFVVVLHKRIGGDVEVTKHMMRDLWFLAAPKHKHQIEDTLALMNGELQLLSLHMAEIPEIKNDPLRGLRLEEALKDLYQDRILQERNSICGVCVEGLKKIAPKKLEVEKFHETLQSLTGIRLYQKSSQEFATKMSSQVSTKLIETLPGGLETHDMAVQDLQSRLLGTLKLHNIGFMKHSRELEAKVFDVMNI